MGYFDGLTNGAFKTDKQGRRLFFLYGKLGKPRLLPTEADEQSMRAKFKSFYKYTFFVLIPVIVVLNAFLARSVTTLVLVGAALIIPMYVWLEIQARKYPKVDGTLTFAEAYSNSAAGHNYWTLIALTALSGLFVLLGVLIIAIGNPEDRWIGIACALFFGACGVVIGWMARLKSKQRKAARVS